VGAGSFRAAGNGLPKTFQNPREMYWMGPLLMDAKDTAATIPKNAINRIPK